MINCLLTLIAASCSFAGDSMVSVLQTQCVRTESFNVHVFCDCIVCCGIADCWRLCDSVMTTEERRVIAQLKNEFGEPLGSTFDLPLSVTAATLQQICNALLHQVTAIQQYAGVCCAYRHCQSNSCPCFVFPKKFYSYTQQ